MASALLGIGFFFLARAWVVERYVVPTGSMEPTFHGDPVSGDRVLVDKTWRPSGGLRPFDLVVVREEPRDLVKRILSAPAPGGPGEILAFEQGDVFVGRTSSSLRRVVKHPDSAAALSMRCVAWTYSASDQPTVGPFEGLELPATLPVARRGDWRRAVRWLRSGWSTSHDLDASFVTGPGRRLCSGRGKVRDIGCELDAHWTSGATLLVDLEVYERHHVFRICERDGSIEYFADDGVGDRTVGRIADTGDGRLRVRIGCLDGRLFVQQLDRPALLVTDGEVPRRVQVVPDRRRPRLPPSWDRRINRISLLAQEGRVTVSRLVLFHDVHYRPDGRARYRVNAGELFLVGDNSYASADSRSRLTEPAFTADDLVGRPVAIVGPWSRMRWLPRTGLIRSVE